MLYLCNFFHLLVQIGSLCMDVIDFELKRYEIMKNDLDARKNPNSKHSKNADFLDSIMNEEKPKEVKFFFGYIF